MAPPKLTISVFLNNSLILIGKLTGIQSPDSITSLNESAPFNCSACKYDTNISICAGTVFHIVIFSLSISFCHSTKSLLFCGIISVPPTVNNPNMSKTDKSNAKLERHNTLSLFVILNFPMISVIVFIAAL